MRVSSSRIAKAAAKIDRVAFVNCLIGARVHVLGIDIVDGDALGRAREAAVVALGVDARTAAVLIVAIPGHHESTRVIHRHGGVDLVAACEGVGPELTAHGGTGRVVTLGVDAPTVAVLIVAAPCHHEVAGGVGRDRIRAPEVVGVLFAGSRCVDSELRTKRSEGCERRCTDRHSSTIIVRHRAGDVVDVR